MCVRKTGRLFILRGDDKPTLHHAQCRLGGSPCEIARHVKEESEYTVWYILLLSGKNKQDMCCVQQETAMYNCAIVCAEEASFDEPRRSIRYS